jgi:hypothetical protein
MADPTQEEIDKGVRAAGRIGAEAGTEALKKQKKKKRGIVDFAKGLYGTYMSARKQMAETRPQTGVRKVAPQAPRPEPITETPPKKKKKPGGVGAVMALIEERKRRLREALGD